MGHGQGSRGDLSGYPQLTAREWQIIRLVARGESNAQIAAALFISPTTVHHHLDHIYEKLDIHNRAALTRWHLQGGRKWAVRPIVAKRTPALTWCHRNVAVCVRYWPDSRT